MLCYIALGSNLGDRHANLRQAIKLLGQTASVRVLRVSSFHETEPVGGPPQGKYINAVAEVETELSPHALLSELHSVERQLARTRDIRWGPRTIDLDIILMGDLVVQEPSLVIPHPRMHEREFVLRPLCELAPGALHPKLHRTVAELLEALANAKRTPEDHQT